ncbi:RNA polymerase sigma factor [Micromonospora chersina]|uniref:RNA polymerase sigma factor n=1 Tax=Micromonospora chersina TaxID=47854 RepID=UPI0037213CC4
MGANDHSFDDQELWTRAQSGETEAFGQLYVRHIQAVANFCFRRTADAALAEDLSSAVFVEVWQNKSRVSLDQPSLLPWLLGVAHNLLRNQWRSARRRRAALERLPPVRDTPDHAEAVAERLDAESDMRTVRAAMARLPRREQEVIELCVWAALPAVDAASVLGVPVGTVHSRLHRGRTRLLALVREAPDTSGHEQGRNTTVFWSDADAMEVCDGGA